MDITFSSKKLENTFNSGKELIREYGPENGKTIMKRMTFLRAARNLEEVPNTPPTRRHMLHEDRKGQFTVDVKQPYRLVFIPDNDPLPQKESGGFDLSRVTAIKILAVENTH